MQVRKPNFCVAIPNLLRRHARRSRLWTQNNYRRIVSQSSSLSIKTTSAMTRCYKHFTAVRYVSRKLPASVNYCGNYHCFPVRSKRLLSLRKNRLGPEKYTLTTVSRWKQEMTRRYDTIIHTDASRGGAVVTGVVCLSVCLSVCLLFRVISPKSMQVGSPNLTVTQKCSTMSPGNSFVSGSKG